MRKIHNSCQDHNGAKNRLQGYLLPAILIFAACVMLIGGCLSSDQPSKTGIDKNCPLEIDTSTWHTYIELADASFNQDQKADIEQWINLFRLPGFEQWAGLIESRKQSPEAKIELLATWMKFANEHLDPDARTKYRRTSRSNQMVNSYKLSTSYSSAIDSLLMGYEDGTKTCQLWDLVTTWVEPDSIPAEFEIYFLPTDDRITFADDLLLVDTGLSMASSPEQLNRQLAGTIYQKYQAIQGPDPAHVEGAKVLTQMWRVLVNESMTSWIQQMPYVSFSKNHPKLKHFTPIPESFFFKSRELVRMFNRTVPPLLKNPADLQNKKAFMDPFNELTLLTMGSHALAETIYHRLGQERLQEASRSLPKFLIAYQEAALMNPTPLPKPGQAGYKLHESMLAFDDEVYTGMLELLNQ